MKLRVTLLIAVIALVTVSCVPMKKYKAAVATNDSLRHKNDSLGYRLDSLVRKLREQTLLVEKSSSIIRQLQLDTSALSSSKKLLRKQYDDLIEKMEGMQKSNQRILSSSADENLKLLNEMNAMREDLAAKERKLKYLDSAYAKINITLEQRTKRLIELESLVNRKDSVLKGLNNALTGALSAFINKDGLSINNKNGVIYVSMEEKLLFKTGSTSVDPKGQDALKKLAKVLEAQTDINILVEGHTDNAAVLDGSIYKDNWDLSVLRATAVVRIMQANSKIDPKRIIASGRSEYLPLEANTSKEGKAKNRRTEIILSPKLDELYKLLEAAKK